MRCSKKRVFVEDKQGSMVTNKRIDSLYRFFLTDTAVSNRISLAIFLCILFTSCSVSKQLAKQAQLYLLSDTALLNAHAGISIFDPASNTYWFNYQAEKYYIPASNTKLFSLYAGMKYLGDSLPAAKYVYEKDTLFILPTGDPTLLHPDFKSQRFFDFLKSSKKPVSIITPNWRDNALGPGWSWDDYNDDYMAERSAMPVYGNMINWVHPGENVTGDVKGDSVFSEPRIPWKYNFNTDATGKVLFVKRNIADNIFVITSGKGKRAEQQVPFVTNGIKSAIMLLRDTLKAGVTESTSMVHDNFSIIYSQPVDSLYKIMMYRSDNFIAEQILLMVSNQKLSYMNDEKIIDTILNTDLKNIPQKPAWADGSGLSRYNLFSPKDFIFILNKMRNEFGFERLKNILPTGGTGTLSAYYLNDSGFIFAKTGSLSNVAAISGFLITKKNKLLIFSLLANNFVSTPTAVRKAFEKFLAGIRQRY